MDSLFSFLLSQLPIWTSCLIAMLSAIYMLWIKIIAKTKFIRRKICRNRLKNVLSQNHTLLIQEGPFQQYSEEKANNWNNICNRVIIPNNEKIIELLDSNLDLISTYNQTKVAVFKAHCAGFKENKESGEKTNSEYPRFSETNIEKIFD